MLDCSEALELIFAAMPRFGDDTVALSDTLGRVLRQNVIAERDQPPFDRVTMDGVALRHAATTSGRRQFTLAGTQHAGDTVLTLDGDDQCIEVMTGAALPCGADTVIPVERIVVTDKTVLLEDGYKASSGQFVHPQGSDHRQGHTMLQVGQRIAPLDVALIASAGVATVGVARAPVLAVISTGSELVAAGQPVAPHQVRLSNGPALVAMLAEQGYTDCRHEHVVDDLAQLQEHLQQLLDISDVLILSGGVSMGKADYVPQVLTELGVEVIFHKIAQRPGKPMWFGKGPDGQAVFALPGNPVSSLTCCRHYVLPALLYASGGLPRPALPAVLAEAYTFRADLTCLLPVRLLPDAAGRLLAKPVPTNTSGDFTALSGSDGYLQLPRRENEFAAGSVQALHLWASV
jgi:molybdopterin molybdotransferase